MKPKLTITKDFTAQFNAAIKKFKNDDVLVGIPESNADRDDENKGEINNAQLLAILNFGSPANNIPAWPVMKMGIRSAKNEITKQFKACAKNVLSSVVHGRSGFDALEQYYTRAGIIASNAIKKMINSQEGAPDLSDATLKARERAGFKGEKRGIVTGQMRNAITYIVKGKG